MRSLIDKLFARSLNYAFEKMSKGQIVYDIGSKFKQTSKLFNKKFSVDGNLGQVQILTRKLPRFHIPANGAKTLVCIRPLLGEYDCNYYEDNSQFESKHIRTIVVQDTLENFIEDPLWEKLRNLLKLGQEPCVMMMNDVHYYLESLPHMKKVQLLVSGLQFETAPG